MWRRKKERKEADDTVDRMLSNSVPFYIYKVAASEAGPRQNCIMRVGSSS